MPIWVRIALVLFAIALGAEIWSVATTSMQVQLEALQLHANFETVFRVVSVAFYLVPGVIAIYASWHGYKWSRSFILLCVLFWVLEYVSGAAMTSLQRSTPAPSDPIAGIKVLLGTLACLLLYLPPSNRWYKAIFQTRFADSPRSDRSRLAAFFLAFFFGFFGVHRFYLGKLSTGFAFLALFIAGIACAGLGATLVYVNSESAPLTVGVGIGAFALIVTWMTIDALRIWHSEMLDSRGSQVS